MSGNQELLLLRAVISGKRRKLLGLEWKSWRLETEMEEMFSFPGFPSYIVIWWAVIVWNDDDVLLNGVVGECDDG